MTFSHIHREEAPHVGEPEDATVRDLAGIAPPCADCGQREALPNADRCEECHHTAGESDG
jgi:hypothetical protein